MLSGELDPAKKNSAVCHPVRGLPRAGAALLLQGLLHPQRWRPPCTSRRPTPSAQVVILYRDIRTYGERELLYKEARSKGVLFVRYDVDHKPVVDPGRRQASRSRCATTCWAATWSWTPTWWAWPRPS